MFSAPTRQLGLAVGLGLSLVTIYTSLFGIFDPGYQRPLTFAACIVVALFVKPLASRYPDQSRGMKALFWGIDAVLLTIDRKSVV